MATNIGASATKLDLARSLRLCARCPSPTKRKQVRHLEYTVKSPCIRSDDGGLNECKRQTLQIQGKQKSRNVTLPDLTAEDAERYRKIGGELDSLYLVSWNCVSHLNQPILLLYYSIGGGSAPYAEPYAKYDAQGNLLNNRATHLPGDVYDAFNEHAKPVHSIMPRI